MIGVGVIWVEEGVGMVRVLTFRERYGVLKSLEYYGYRKDIFLVKKFGRRYRNSFVNKVFEYVGIGLFLF